MATVQENLEQYTSSALQSAAKAFEEFDSLVKTLVRRLQLNSKPSSRLL